MELQLFSNAEFGEIRAVDVNGVPYIVGKDAAAALGYTDTDKAIRNHVDSDDKLTRQIGGSGQARNMTVINESGLYALILGSQLPSAKQFKKWVTSEVLPAIRKTGKYETPATKQRSLGEVNSAARIITKTLKEAGMAPPFIAVALQSLYAPVGVKIPLEGITVQKKLYDATAIASRLGIYSKSGKPHAQAVGAIIAKLPLVKGERENVPFQNQDSGHSGTNWQYSESVVEKVIVWLEKFNYPAEIQHQGKSYKVTYQRVPQSA